MARPLRHPAAASPVALALALALGVAACAGPGGGLAPRGDGPSSAARAALDALLARNDAAAAAAALGPAPLAAVRDPWALAARALLARRALDGAGELAALARLAEVAPDHPLALTALRRLGELPEASPEQARAVEAAVAPLTASGRLSGLAAFRARVARIAAAEALGEVERVARLRAENGAVTAWTLSGPHGLLHAVDFDAPTAPEQGTLPAALPAPLLGLPYATRTLPVPDGMTSLDGEPADGDQYLLASEVTLTRGGRYLAILGTTGAARAWLDGAPLLERRAFEGPAPGQLVRPVSLSAGTHRLLLKLARAGDRRAAIVHLLRADGAPSDLAARAPAPGPLPAVRPGPFPPSALSAAALAASLEAGGPAAAALLAGRDAMTGDLEGAKALLDGALARLPASAPLLAARGVASDEDPTLDEQIGKGRAEAALRAALAADPGAGDARLALAELLRRSDRASDAEALLGALPDDQARRPAALALRARVAEDRGFSEAADGLAEAARAAGGSCDALKLLAELSARREAVARKDELERALLGCRGGRERLARHLVSRGEAAEAAALLEPLTRTRPAAIQAAIQRAHALSAAGDPAAAAASLGPALAAWPRATQLWKARADQRELGGDRAGARADREAALRLDGGDLTLRRALALESGAEPLAAEAVDGLAAIRDYLKAPMREDASSVLVLDAAAIEFHPGGASTERVHQVFRVLDQEAVDHQGEAQLPAGAQRLALRTVKPDGRILEPEEGEGKGATSLPGLEPGDFVELEFLRGVPASRPAAGVASEPFYFATPGTSMFRSTYLVTAPEGFGLAADAHGMPAVPTLHEGGREVVRHEARAVPALIPEPAAPPLPEYAPFLHVGTGGGRDVAQRLLADLLAERPAPTLELRAAAAAVRARADAAAPGGKAGPEALARAAYDEVRRLVVGQGGSIADDASAVLSRGRGSRLTLLKALLDLLGVPARFAALRPFGNDQTAWRYPGPGLWAHPVLRVELPGRVAWLDPALRQQPFGFLPERALDAEALVLAPPGAPGPSGGQLDRTPAANPGPDQRTLDLAITLDADGGAAVEGSDRYPGALGAGAKAALERLDQAARRQAVEALLTRSLRGVRLTELAIEGEEDPEAPLTMRWKGTAAGLAREGGGALLVDAPLMAARLGARYVRLATRETALLIDGGERSVMRLTVRPPPGRAVRPVAAERLDGPFGRFERTERLEGGALVREDRLELKRGRIPPGEYGAFAGFAGGVDEIQARPVAFPRDVGAAPAP